MRTWILGCVFVGSAARLFGADFTTYTEPMRNIEISAPEPGIVQEVIVKEGQTVKAGQILVKLDTRVIERDAEIAREELKFKTARLEKLTELLDKKFASPHEVERAQSDVDITTLKLRRAEALIERLTLRSPIDGVVTEVRYDVSESVQGANSHVASVVQLSPMRVQFNLPVEEARKLKAGDQVSLNFPDITSDREASVEFVSPVSTAVVNTVRVTMIIPDPERQLTAGMKCIYRTAN
jgi:RND family efflux transporter MFP subunit